MAGEFMFNFNLEDGGKKSNESVSHACEITSPKGTTASPNSVPNSVQVAKLIPVLPFHKEAVDHIGVTSVYCIPGSSIKLEYISGQQAYAIASSTSSNNEHGSGIELKSLLTLSDSKHSDLIPGVYEGGLKVWECALDLIQFLSEHDFNFTGMKILELGCGTGLPGIYSLVKGAECVHFQDYNPEVVNYVTIPNVLLNTRNRNEEKAKFYSGDWSMLPPILGQGVHDRYDVILTSETIYSIESQPKLLSALKQLCCPVTGVVYVAAKTFYFGVGGGVDSFCKLLEEDRTFSVTQCKKTQTSVPRVILKLTPHH